MKSKPTTSPALTVKQRLILIAVIVLALPGLFYFFTDFDPEPPNVKFRQNGLTWVHLLTRDQMYWDGPACPKKWCLWTFKTTGEGNFAAWKKENEPGFALRMEILGKTLFEQYRAGILGLGEDLRRTHHAALTSASLMGGILAFCLLGYFFLFSRRWTPLLWGLSLGQFAVFSHWLAQPELRPMGEYLDQLPWDSYWFLPLLILLLVFSSGFTVYTLYALVTRHGWPSLKRAFRNIFRPQAEDAAKRSQMDVTQLQLHRDRINLPGLMRRHNPKGELVLGAWHDRAGRPALLAAKELSRHMLVVGGTGTGKTLSVNLPLIAQAMFLDQAVVIASWKHDRDFIFGVNRLCQQKQRDFMLITLHHGRPSGAGRAWSSLGYNPLSHGDAMQLRDRLMVGLDLDQPGPAQFYGLRQRESLKAILDAMQARGMRPTFSRIAHAIEEEVFMRTVLPEWDERFKQDCAGLRARLVDLRSFWQFDSPHAEADLAGAVERQAVLYLDLDCLGYPEYAAGLGRMFFMDLLHLASTRQPGLAPVLVVLDEYQQALCPAVTQLVAQVRGAGLQLVLANQSLSQLAAPEVGASAFLHTVWSNTESKLFFKQKSPTDARLVSQATGTEFFKLYQCQLHAGWEARGPLDSEEMPGGAVSLQQKNLIPENVLLNLPPFMAVSILPCQQPGVISTGHLWPLDHTRNSAAYFPVMRAAANPQQYEEEMEAFLASFASSAKGGKGLMG